MVVIGWDRAGLGRARLAGRRRLGLGLFNFSLLVLRQGKDWQAAGQAKACEQKEEPVPDLVYQPSFKAVLTSAGHLKGPDFRQDRCKWCKKF
ncbi:hypothetical protein PPACK8108_LOCUS25062 [Phakopsora pachyrhizi]|uniref:Uncharacterized protein n=1 Tax=Phakopsora pachyrhizi TaxID=170000 RepID=A0AAV0BUW1_PHAPC|nr:hypothetical protein PPACK8108_LOCUS25062 [Phakopsora pachyrhizi]